MSTTTSMSNKIIKASILGLTGLGILAIFMWAYVSIFLTRDLRGVNIIGDTGAVVECEDEDCGNRELRPFVEVNTYTNRNRNGYFFQEIRFNYFDGLRVDDETMKRSSGIQWLSQSSLFDYDSIPWISSRASVFGINGAWSPNLASHEARGLQRGLFGVTESMGVATNEIDFSRRAKVMTIPIDGNPFQVNVDRIYRRSNNMVLANASVRYFYNWTSIFDNITTRALNMVTTDGTFQREGTFLVSMPLLNMLSIREIRNGQVERDTADRIDTYVLVRITINSNGFRNARQSLFGIVGGQGDFDLSVTNEYNTDFAQYRTHINLREQHFDRRFSIPHGGYVISVSSFTRQQLERMRRYRLFIELNIDIMRDVIGIDFNGLRGLDIHCLRITGSGTVHLFEFALADTTITNLYIGEHVLLINHGNAIPMTRGVTYAK